MPVNSSRFNLNLWLVSLILLVPQVAAALPVLTRGQLDWLGEQIYANECNRQARCLTSWNPGEDFPSLGIGHFIWFRSGQQERFQETFPALLAFYQQMNVMLPDWLVQPAASPWPDRDSFYAEFEGPRLSGLREFLGATTGIQVAFILQRMELALPELVDAAPADRQAELAGLLEQLANSQPPRGVYALMDYINFKGEGLSPLERYQGQGWGLQQVLEDILLNGDPRLPLLQQFSQSAANVLRRRVALSPPERQEQRWLAGWLKRVDGYDGALP